MRSVTSLGGGGGARSFFFSSPLDFFAYINRNCFSSLEEVMRNQCGLRHFLSIETIHTRPAVASGYFQEIFNVYENRFFGTVLIETT